MAFLSSSRVLVSRHTAPIFALAAARGPVTSASLPSTPLHLSLRSFSASLSTNPSFHLWSQQSPKKVGQQVPLHEDFMKSTLPEGPSDAYAKYMQWTTESPRYLHRQCTQEAISRLEDMREAGFPDALSSRGTVLLDGIHGAGKSTAMTQLALWARTNGWIVLFIRSGKRWTRGGDRILASQFLRGYWDQVSMEGTKGPAFDVLEALLKCHGDQLDQVKLKRDVNLSSGFKSDHSDPRTLKDLVAHGAREGALDCCEVLYYVKKELEVMTEFPVMILIDGYNAFDAVGQWTDPSIVKWEDPAGKKYPRMQNAKGLSLSKMFALEEDGSNTLVNGTVVVCQEHALSCRIYKETTEKTLKEGGAVTVEIPPFSPDEVKSVAQTYQELNSKVEGLFNDATCKYIFMVNGGVGKDVAEYMQFMLK